MCALRNHQRDSTTTSSLRCFEPTLQPRRRSPRRVLPQLHLYGSCSTVCHPFAGNASFGAESRPQLSLGSTMMTAPLIGSNSAKTSHDHGSAEEPSLTGGSIDVMSLTPSRLNGCVAGRSGQPRAASRLPVGQFGASGNRSSPLVASTSCSVTTPSQGSMFLGTSWSNRNAVSRPLLSATTLK